MRFYMAPMEGITGYIFRQAYHKCYGNVDCYFAPFLMSRKLNQKRNPGYSSGEQCGNEAGAPDPHQSCRGFLSIAGESSPLATQK